MSKWLTHDEDTIVAIATAVAESGLGVIRISGREAFALLKAVAKSRLNFLQWEARKLYLIDIVTRDDHSDYIIDQGMAVYFQGPKSFTGEDVVELHLHGSPLVLEMTLQLLIEKGARLAEPGEFSYRAFIHDKLDLAQAEAIADVIHAKSELALTVAQKQLQGRLSDKSERLKEELLTLMSRVELAIDFPEEDVTFLGLAEIQEQLCKIETELLNWKSQFSMGKSLKEGLSLVLVGQPNVGKSSLLNALLKEERAIVTSQPGTTRDVIESSFHYQGVLFTVFDTAGLRESEDLIEKEGIRRARECLKRADIVLHLFDASFDLKTQILPQNIKVPLLAVVNKMDLISSSEQLDGLEQNSDFQKIVYISATQSQGLEQLMQSIMDLSGLAHFLEQQQDSLLSNTRHLGCIEKSLDSLQCAKQRLSHLIELECAAADIRIAADYLSEITGKIDVEDVLSKIFKDFCIGK